MNVGYGSLEIEVCCRLLAEVDSWVVMVHDSLLFVILSSKCFSCSCGVSCGSCLMGIWSLCCSFLLSWLVFLLLFEEVSFRSFVKVFKGWYEGVMFMSDMTRFWST